MESCLVRNHAYLEPLAPEPLELTPEELEEVDRILNKYQALDGAIVPILQYLSAKYNWLPPGAVQHVSEVLDMPLSRVLRIATFYNMFSLEPRGKNIIQVCLGTACHVKGGGRILETFERELNISAGRTTEDMRFTLEAVRCLGCCGLAPVVTVNGEVHGKMTPGQVVKVLDVCPV